MYDTLSCVFVGVGISLQERLLSPQHCDLTFNFESKDDMEFLESFAGVVGARWPSLAVSFSLGEEVIEEVRREGSCEKERALLLLVKWATTENATFGQLYQLLQAFSLQ